MARTNSNQTAPQKSYIEKLIGQVYEAGQTWRGYDREFSATLAVSRLTKDEASVAINELRTLTLATPRPMTGNLARNASKERAGADFDLSPLDPAAEVIGWSR